MGIQRVTQHCLVPANTPDDKAVVCPKIRVHRGHLDLRVDRLQVSLGLTRTEMFDPVEEDVDQVPFGVAREVKSIFVTKETLVSGLPARRLQDIRERAIGDTARFRALKHGPEFGHGGFLALLVPPHQLPEVFADVTVAARRDL